jgi:hypothetical protein
VGPDRNKLSLNKIKTLWDFRAFFNYVKTFYYPIKNT